MAYIVFEVVRTVKQGKVTSNYQSSKHTTLFGRCKNVVDVQTTLLQLGISITHYNVKTTSCGKKLIN